MSWAGLPAPDPGEWGYGNPYHPQPVGWRVQLGIGPDGALIDVTDDIDVTSYSLEVNNDTGAATFSFQFLQEVGDQYDVPDNCVVLVDDNLHTDGAGRWPRFFMGYTMQPDSTAVQPYEGVYQVSCVDTGWWEKYPPMNVGPEWPPGGLPYVDTVILWSISGAGTYTNLRAANMRNIVPGRHLYVMSPDVPRVNTAHLERIEIASTNFEGSVLITDHIAAAGTGKTVHVPADRIGDFSGGQVLFAQNIDSTHFEHITITSVDSGANTITFDCINSHNTDWTLMAGEFSATFAREHAAISTTVADGWTEFMTTQTVTPASMSGCYDGAYAWCDDGSLPELVTVMQIWDDEAGDPVAFDAIFGWPKDAAWDLTYYPQLFGGISDADVLKGPIVTDVDGMLLTLPGAIDEFICTTHQQGITDPVSGGANLVSTADMQWITPGRTLWCSNYDGTNKQCVTVDTIGTGEFTATFPKALSGGWICFNGPWIDQIAITEVQPSLGPLRWEFEPFASIFTKLEAEATDIDTICLQDVAESGSPQWVAPENMYGISANKTLECYNDDGTQDENLVVLATSATAFQAVFTSGKTAGVSGWHIQGQVQPCHSWRFNRPGSAYNLVWWPQVRYMDRAVREGLSLLQLTDTEALDPDTDAPYTVFHNRRSGSDRYNSIIVRGSNGSWAEYTDWDSVATLGGRKLQAPPVTRQELTTNQACYDWGATLVGSSRRTKRALSVETASMVDPELFYSRLWVKFFARPDGSVSVGGDQLPIIRATLTRPEGVPRYALELGEPPPEHLARSRVPIQDVFALLVEGKPMPTKVVGDGDVLADTNTTYAADASDGEVWLTVGDFLDRFGWGRGVSGICGISGGLPLPEWLVPSQSGNAHGALKWQQMGRRWAGGQGTYQVEVMKIDQTLNDVVIQAPPGATIDGKQRIKVRFPGQSVLVRGYGNRFYTVGRGPDSPRTIQNTEDHILYTNEAKDTVLGINHGGGMTYLNGYYGDNAYGVGIATANAGARAEPDVGFKVDGNLHLWGAEPAAFNLDLTNPSNARFYAVCNATSANRTIYLPDLSSQETGNCLSFVVGKSDSSANTVTIQAYSGQTIDGASTKVLDTPQSILIRSTGSDSSWRTELTGGGSAPSSQPKEIEWQILGDDTTTTDIKHPFQVPFACTITEIGVYQFVDGAYTTINDLQVNLWRLTGESPPALEADPMNPSPMTVDGTGYWQESTFSGWANLDLDADDWLAWEIVAADSGAVALTFVVKVVPA